MKQLFKISAVIVVFTLMSFSYETLDKSTADNAIRWREKSIDVGEIQQGIPKQITYEFTNAGKSTVIITNVHPSCGCTAADYTKGIIGPGRKGYIKATFDAKNPGAFHKTVTVTTNIDPSPHVLNFNGRVVPTT